MGRVRFEISGSLGILALVRTGQIEILALNVSTRRFLC